MSAQAQAVYEAADSLEVFIARAKCIASELRESSIGNEIDAELATKQAELREFMTRNYQVAMSALVTLYVGGRG